MSESDPTESGIGMGGLRERTKEVRYSLKEMMEEVREERKESILGRELLDSTEIEKMFSARIRKIKGR